MSTIYQFSHFLAVSKGCYEGEISVGELKQYGNTGLGTFNALNGELVVIDNTFYHCSNGQPRIAEDSERLAWAAITLLQQYQVFSLSHISSLAKLQEAILNNLPSPNYPFALSIKANVQNIALGSVPKQQKPYKAISEVIEESLLINTGKRDVNIVGFYAPEFMHPIKSSGLHLHFVDEKVQIGGHILDIDLNHAEISLQQINSFNLLLPQIDLYKKAKLNIAFNETLPVFKDKLEQNQ